MWKRLPLRTRLLLPLGIMFVAAVVLGMVALHLFSTEQLAEESGPAVRSAEAVAGALNASLQASSNPRQTLDAFTRTLGSGETIRFRAADDPAAFQTRVEIQTPFGKVPRW